MCSPRLTNHKKVLMTWKTRWVALCDLIPVRWRRRWRALWGLFPLSWGGCLLMVGLMAYFYFFGVLQQDRVLALACVCLFLVGCLALPLTIEAAAAVFRRWRRASAEVPSDLKRQWVAGMQGWLPLGFSLPRRPFVDIGWAWSEPSAAKVELQKTEDGLAEAVTFGRRCLITRIERRFEIRDVLGIACIRWTRSQAVNLEVLPAPAPLDEATLVHSLHSGDDISDPWGEPVGDRVDMRRYAAGDPPRLILWKIFARSRKLMVRIPERALSPTPRTCAYLVAGPHDEQVAGLLRSILESGLLGSGWRFGADGNSDSTSRLDEALTFLARSGNPESREETQIGSFLEQARKDGYQSCLIGVPAGQGPWLAAVQGAVRKAGLSVNFLSAGDGRAAAAARAQGPWAEKLSRWMLRPAEEVVHGEPERVLRQLEQGAGKRLLYQRTTGQVVTV